MNRAELAQLLAVIEQVDHRKWDQLTVGVWLGLVGDLSIEDAAEAVRRHFRNSREYLTPQHIRAGVDAIRTERYEADLSLGAAPAVVDLGEQRGEKIVRYVVAGLAEARRRNGGNLGRQRSADLGEQLVREALQRWPVKAPTTVRGAHCGRGGCRCTHDLDPVTGERCDGGWVEIVARPDVEQLTLDAAGDPIEHRDAGQVGMVRKCGTCDPDAAERIDNANSRTGARGDLVDRRTVIAARHHAQATLRARKKGKP